MKPSERIEDIYFKMRGNQPDLTENWVIAIIQYLDEQAESNGEANGK